MSKKETRNFVKKIWELNGPLSWTWLQWGRTVDAVRYFNYSHPSMLHFSNTYLFRYYMLISLITCELAPM